MNNIFIVTHASPNFTAPEGYSFLKVGSAAFEAEYSDDSGDNISQLNPYYCELTGLYWIWKNYKCDPEDVVGLVHYRRVFGDPGIYSILKKRFLPIEKIVKDLSRSDLIIPDRRYFKNGIYNHYKKYHEIGDLEVCLEYLRSNGKLPLEVENMIMSDKRGVVCNMFITKKKTLDEYCEWLFPMFFSVEKSLDLDSRSDFQKRAMGFLGENLFNAWLWSKPDLVLTERPILKLYKSAISNLNSYRKHILYRSIK